MESDRNQFWLPPEALGPPTDAEKWFLFYFAIAHNCDMPILEAFFHVGRHDLKFNAELAQTTALIVQTHLHTKLAEWLGERAIPSPWLSECPEQFTSNNGLVYAYRQDPFLVCKLKVDGCVRSVVTNEKGVVTLQISTFSKADFLVEKYLFAIYIHSNWGHVAIIAEQNGMQERLLRPTFGLQLDDFLELLCRRMDSELTFHNPSSSLGRLHFNGEFTMLKQEMMEHLRKLPDDREKGIRMRTFAHLQGAILTHFCETGESMLNLININAGDYTPIEVEFLRKAVLMPENVKVCGNCGREMDSLNHCARCKSILYCSVKCQKDHWPSHRTKCRPRD